MTLSIPSLGHLNDVARFRHGGGITDVEKLRRQDLQELHDEPSLLLFLQRPTVPTILRH